MGAWHHASTGRVWCWYGTSPFFYVWGLVLSEVGDLYVLIVTDRVPDDEALVIKALKLQVRPHPRPVGEDVGANPARPILQSALTISPAPEPGEQEHGVGSEVGE